MGLGSRGNKTRLIYRGVEADGCTIPTRSAFWMSSADCPVLVITDGERVVACHCGYRSLIDHGAVQGKPTRSHFSMVDALLEQFGTRVRRSKLKAFITLGIGPHYLEASAAEVKTLIGHERHISRKAAQTYVARDGMLDIVELVRCQCLNRGVGEVKTDGHDTYADRKKQGYRWWSCERARVMSPKDLLKRNGVLVVRRD